MQATYSRTLIGRHDGCLRVSCLCPIPGVPKMDGFHVLNRRSPHSQYSLSGSCSMASGSNARRFPFGRMSNNESVGLGVIFAVPVSHFFVAPLSPSSVPCNDVGKRSERDASADTMPSIGYCESEIAGDRSCAPFPFDSCDSVQFSCQSLLTRFPPASNSPNRSK
jgi:hypothetical protein